MTDWENFTLYYALSLSANAASESALRISNTDESGTGGNDDQDVKLEYCIPIEFSKRRTDTSNAQATDTQKPDTGTAINQIELKITIDRSSANQPDDTLLQRLLEMHFSKSNNIDGFKKGRFGLLNADNPELDVKPTAFGGYKWDTFFQVPNPDNPALLQYIIRLDYIGDHTLLGAFQ